MTLLRASVLASLFAVAMTGCAPAAPPSSENVAAENGATIIEANAAQGSMLIAFRKDGREIRFDLRLGVPMLTPPSPEELAADPLLPTYDVDARVMDGAGQVFHMQAGADAFLDSSWRMPHVEGIDEGGRAKDYRLAVEAGPALVALQVPAGLEQLRLAAIQIARGLEHVAEKPGATPVVTEPTPTEPTEPGSVSPKGGLYYGSSYTRYWDYQVRKKDIQFTWGLANHSAVTLRGWSSGYGLLFSAASCNHGTCSTSMGGHCVMSGYRADDGTRTRWFYKEPSTSTGTVSGGCSTGYAWNSACGGHNCNDDSQVQGESIYYDRSYDTWHGHCSACGARYSAPNPPACN